MGYDMHQVIEPDGAAEHKAAHQAKLNAADAALAALRDERGDWLSEFEQSVLTEDERLKLRADRRQEYLQKWRAEHTDAEGRVSLTGYDEFEMRAQTIPASEAYITAYTEQRAALMSDPHHSEYFRLNIGGMGRYASIMEVLGMLKDGRGREEWPKSDGIPEDVEEALDEAWYAPHPYLRASLDRNEIEAYLKQATSTEEWVEEYGKLAISKKNFARFVDHKLKIFEHLTKHDTSVPGIDVIKFSTNDGWWVTKEECQSALDAWNGQPDEVKAGIVQQCGDYWLLWIEYIENGAKGNGFTVH